MVDGKVFRIGGVDYTVEMVPELNRLYSLWGSGNLSRYEYPDR